MGPGIYDTARILVFLQTLSFAAPARAESDDKDAKDDKAGDCSVGDASCELTNLAILLSSMSLEELLDVTVTVRKRGESLQRVPVAVTAYTAEDIERRGLIDIERIEENTPSFTFDYLAGTRARGTIRGIGSDETGIGGDASTAVFVDGVYLGRTGMHAVDVYDMEQIEILRGPQGTLWGKNVVGGTLNFQTAKPVDGFRGRLQLTGGTANTLQSEGMVNIPVTNYLKARFAFATKDSGGYGRNAFTGGDLDDVGRRSARMHLLFSLGRDSTLLLSADYTRDDSAGRVGNTHDPEGLDNDGAFTNRADIDGFNERETWGVSATLEHPLAERVRLTGIAAARAIDDAVLEDWDGLNRIEEPDANHVNLGFADDAIAGSTEWRIAGTLESLAWVSGVYFSRESGDSEARLELDLATGADSAEEPFDLVRIYAAEATTTSYAAFGELTYNIVDRVRATGGFRFTSDRKDYSGSRTSNGEMEFAGQAGQAIFDELTWHAAADLSLTETSLLYTSVSTGFKSGAFRLLANDIDDVMTPVRPESAVNYEAGYKGSLFGGRLRTNLAAFVMLFEDLQIVQFTATAGEAINAPEADIRGIEADARVHILRGLSLDAKYSYIDSAYEVTQDVDTPGIVDGAQVIRTPEHDVVFTASYERDLANYGALLLDGQLSHRSRVFDDPDNNPQEVRPARTLVNAALGWRSPSGAWAVRLWGRNLTDESYFNRVSNIFTAFGQSTSGPPRSFGLTVRRLFGDIPQRSTRAPSLVISGG